MVDGSGLKNRNRAKPIEGSNPSVSNSNCDFAASRLERFLFWVESAPSVFINDPPL